MISSILATTLLLALPGADARACSPHSPSGGAKALYLISNTPSNAVIALPIGPDGLLLGNGTSTPTGGAGASGMTAMGVAGPDSLFSQAPLTIVGDKLFAVNPGSNTLSMFAISPSDPTKLTMLGSPAPIPGDFPVTVSASRKSKQVCVGTSGARAGVSCAPFSPDNDKAGLGQMDALRPFELGQSTPPLGPLNSVSQVLFSHDGRWLFAMVKGDPSVNKTGYLASFEVAAKAGVVSQKGVRSYPNGTAVLFGSVLVPWSDNLFVTDASFGAAVLGVDSQSGTGRTIGVGRIDGQKATCWAAVSEATRSAWVTDVATNRLVEMSLADAGVKSVIDLQGASGDPGLIDLGAAGRLVYALSPGNGTTGAAVAVVDVVARKQVQHFELVALGGTKAAAGLALLK